MDEYVIKKQELEDWVQSSRPRAKMIYYEGFLINDRDHSMPLKKLGKLALSMYEKGLVILYQKKLSHGDTSKDPVFEYIAQRI